jgi:predicted DNA-binding transcriptional regulator AlpA
MSEVVSPDFISIRDVQKKYGISRSSFYRLVKSGGDIEIVKIGDRTMVSVASLSDWIARLPRTLSPPRFSRGALKDLHEKRVDVAA